MHVDSLFLVNLFSSRGNCSSIFDFVGTQIPTTIIRVYSTYMVNHNFKMSPSDRYISAANAICKVIHIFNKDYILLTDIL
jgi:hypothetical protein